MCVSIYTGVHVALPARGGHGHVVVMVQVDHQLFETWQELYKGRWQAVDQEGKEWKIILKQTLIFIVIHFGS